jgi:cell wall-associated NlpC family hydrolase
MDLVEYAKYFIGRPYIWAGNGSGKCEGGFDCSGLVVECLQAVGVLANGSDYSAKALYKHLLDQGWVKVPRGFETASDLCFWGKAEGSINHVSIVIGPRQHLEAGGGGSGSKTAGTSTGMVRVRPLSSRGDLLATLRMP